MSCRAPFHSRVSDYLLPLRFLVLLSLFLRVPQADFAAFQMPGMSAPAASTTPAAAAAAASGASVPSVAPSVAPPMAPAGTAGPTVAAPVLMVVRAHCPSGLLRVRRCNRCKWRQGPEAGAQPLPLGFRRPARGGGPWGVTSNHFR